VRTWPRALNARAPRRGALLVLLMVVASTSCMRERAKREAKARVFAPPPADPMTLLAQETIDINTMPDEAAVRDRVHRMPFAEVTARLGPLTYQGEMQIVFQRGDSHVSSTETSTLRQGPRDFSLDVVMHGGDEQHLVFHDGTFFVRHNFGRWRASRDPTDERRRWREESYALWRAVYDLFQDRIQFTDTGATSHQGRRAVRYAMRVSPPTEPDPVMPPELIWPTEGETAKQRDQRLARRATEWRAYSVPLEGEGQIVIDEEKAVPLQVRFEGRLRVRDADAEPALLAVKLTCQLSKIGVDPEVGPPADSVEEFARRKIVTNPLSFLDGGTGGPAASPAPKGAPAPEAAPAPKGAPAP